MKNILVGLLATSMLFFTYGFNGSTTSAVCLVGGVIKAKNIVDSSKYKRKDCPICKGKGFYISGDGISKVECGYCEPEAKEVKPVQSVGNSISRSSGVIISSTICGPNGCRVIQK